MMYTCHLSAENGASHTFDFEADNNELAGDHAFTVASHPAMYTSWDALPEGEIKIQFRRHYAETWHTVGTFDFTV